MSIDDPVQSALATRLGDDVATALLSRLERYSNLPNTVKGTAKAEPAPDVEAAALAVVEDPELTEELIAGFRFWGLLTLAARADVGVLDRTAERLADEDHVRRLLASIRRATAKHDAAAPRPAATDAPAPSAPQKVSAVKAWLAAHPTPDPEELAPRPRQRAAARAAAVRALGAIGTPRALDVLSRYAAESYPDAVLTELHRAWGAFDRRDFAAAMFRPAPYTLDLGIAPSLEGIGAVPGLTSLDVVLTDGADLTPLTECTALHTLRVGAEGEPGLLGVEPLLALPELSELHLTRTTRHADLTPLADLAVRRLVLDLDGADGAFLLRMPRLERLLLRDDAPPEASDHDNGAVAAALVRAGVQVTVYRHQAAAFATLTEQAGSADLTMVEQSGYLGFSRDHGALEDLRRRLFSNLVP